MLEHQLRDQLSRVGQRLGRLWLWRQLTWCWIGFAVLALAWLGLGRPYALMFAAIVGGSWLTATLLWVRSKSLALAKSDIARHVERAFPELDSRLLAALEQCPDVQSGRWNVLQRQVIAEAVHHSHINDWTEAVPAKRMRNAFLGQSVALMAFVALCLSLLPTAAQRASAVTVRAPFQSAQAVEAGPTIEPGDCEIERGSSLLVLARFSDKLPAGVNLVWRTLGDATVVEVKSGATGTNAIPVAAKSEPEQRLPLTKSLDDPIFGGRLPAVKHDLRYLIDFDGKQSREYKITVYDRPSLVRSDLELTFPGYTGLDTKKLEDAFEATVVEGTTIRVTCRVNKPLASVKLVENEKSSLTLTADPANPLVYQADFVPTKRHKLKLVLTDDAGRVNRDAEEFRFEALPNRPPELKLAFPGQDVKVSPLEEVLVEASASDDFGLVETGIVLTIPGREPLTITLGKDQPGSQQRKLSHLQRLEELKVEPDELISYYVYADDFGPDGQQRRTSSDLFFAEVRPFEEIFRQLESPPGGQSQAAGSQQQGNPLTKLAELQKQIVVATWKLARSQQTSSSNPKWDPKLAEQVKVIRESQQKAIEQLEALAEKQTDAKSIPILASIAEKMAAADRALGQSLSESSLTPLTPAAAAEQAAYQGLLKLRAREHLMMKGSQSSSGSSGSASVSEQQLNQLELDNKKNRYEDQKQAQQQPGQQQQENLAMLDRLKELAKRQEGVNEQLKELEAALRTAKTEAEKEELERQLKRLRDDQQQLLHDADELSNKMAQSPQQEKLNDTRQQLEQTRQQMVDATEKLREGQLSQALNAGTRAERELQQLQEDFRKQTSAQFADSMRTLREEARQLAENEKQLAERLAALQDEAKRSLRQSKDRQNLEAEFKEQRQQTNDLVDAAKSVVEQSETAEPLLSKQLYDTVRSSREMKTDQALDATSQLLRAGFLPEAQKAEEQAREGIDRLKQGIERATEGILGDEVESLKRARRELADLAEQLDKEIAMQQPGSGEKKPDEQGDGDSKANSPTGEGQPTIDPSLRRRDEQPGEDGRKGQPSKANPDGKQPGNGEGSPKEGQPPGEGQPQQGAGKQPGQGQKGQSQLGKSQGQGEGKPGLTPGGKGSPQDGQPSPNGQPGQAGSQGEGAGGQGESPGGESSNKPGRAGLRGQSQRGGAKPSPGKPQGGDQGGQGGGPGSGNEGPLTGEKFTEWNERLRDVESMVSDPKLQAEVAKVRERARSVRADFKRHSQTPNWDLVRTTVREPLTELQRQLAEEISRRESPDSLVPVDRDPVPTRYRDLVRGYYERLGSGKADGAKVDAEKSK